MAGLPWVDKRREYEQAKQRAKQASFSASAESTAYRHKTIASVASGPHITPEIRKQRRTAAARQGIRAAGKHVVAQNRIKKMNKK